MTWHPAGCTFPGLGSVVELLPAERPQIESEALKLPLLAAAETTVTPVG